MPNVYPGESVVSVTRSKHQQAEMLFVTKIVGPRIGRRFNSHMLAIDSSNTVWKLPFFLKAFSNFSPLSTIQYWQVRWLQSLPNCKANLRNYFVRSRAPNPEIPGFTADAITVSEVPKIKI